MSAHSPPLFMHPHQAVPDAAAWLRPFRGRIDFSGDNLAVYCQLGEEAPAAEELTAIVQQLVRSGWLRTLEPAGVYRVHPSLPCQLPVVEEANRAYVHFFQHLGKRWSAEADEKGVRGSANNFPVVEMLNLEHALSLAIKTGISPEYLVWSLDSGYQILFAHGKRILRLEQIVGALERQVTHADGKGLEFDLLSCLDLLANACKSDKQYDRAEHLYLQVIARCERLKDMAVFVNKAANTALYQSALATALVHLVALRRERGDLDGSWTYWEKAASLAAEADLPSITIDVLSEAGLWYKARRQFEQSEQYLQRALELSENPFRKGQILVNLAALADQRGDKTDSLALNHSALGLLEPFGAQAPLGAIYTNLGLTYASIGNRDYGEYYTHKAMEWFYAQGDWFAAGECYQNMGNLCFAQRDLIPAQEYYQKARAAFQHAEAPLLVAETLQNEAEVLRLRDEPGAARQMAEQAAGIFRQNGHLEGEASAILNGANAMVAEGELERAVAAFQQALTLFGQAGAKEGQGLVHQNLAEIARRIGDYANGSAHLKQAAAFLAQPEGREHLPRLVAYANVFSNHFQNKEVLNQIAEQLNALLDEATLQHVVELAREHFDLMSGQ